MGFFSFFSPLFSFDDKHIIRSLQYTTDIIQYKQAKNRAPF